MVLAGASLSAADAFRGRYRLASGALSREGRPSSLQRIEPRPGRSIARSGALLEGFRYPVELALALTIRSLAFGLAAATSQWEVDSLAHLLHLPAPLNGSPERERGRSKRAVRRPTLLLAIARSLAPQASKVRRTPDILATPSMTPPPAPSNRWLAVDLAHSCRGLRAQDPRGLEFDDNDVRRRPWNTPSLTCSGAALCRRRHVSYWSAHASPGSQSRSPKATAPPEP